LCIYVTMGVSALALYFALDVFFEFWGLEKVTLGKFIIVQL
jgi:hypothetical protein